tara:strand:- start:2714 stop:3943 length:1230 start_codon:yes stop_codon:yes gene_type:complete
LKKKLVVIGFVWPEPKSSAAGRRMMQLISFFQSQEYEITFASACVKSDNAFDLTSIGIEKATIELNHSSFDDFISNLNPDVVLFDRFMTEEQFGWRVAEQCPNAMKILDTEDLHFLRRARQQAFKEDTEVTLDNLLNDTTKREIASIYRCDLSLIISTAEMSLLQDTFKIDGSLLLYIPFLIETISEEKKKKLSNFEDRHHFISIGNFRHEPNYNALLYLKETIWKEIRAQLPNAQLHNYGAYVSQKVNQLHNENDGFLIKGFVEDVNEVMQRSKVLLAPIRFGAGLKGKLFDAMQNGIPFVSTSVGVEGIVSDETLDLVCDTSEDFVRYSVKLYREPSTWKEQQTMGFKILEEQFSKGHFEDEFKERLLFLVDNLKAHRQQNFTGQLLQHHTLRSTKYMSKWIEAKNS